MTSYNSTLITVQFKFHDITMYWWSWVTENPHPEPHNRTTWIEHFLNRSLVKKSCLSHRFHIFHDASNRAFAYVWTGRKEGENKHIVFAIQSGEYFVRRISLTVDNLFNRCKILGTVATLYFVGPNFSNPIIIIYFKIQYSDTSHFITSNSAL